MKIMTRRKQSKPRALKRKSNQHLFYIIFFFLSDLLGELDKRLILFVKSVNFFLIFLFGFFLMWIFLTHIINVFRFCGECWWIVYRLSSNRLLEQKLVHFFRNFTEFSF